MSKKTRSNFEKLKEAWEKMPYGGKSIAFEISGYTRQNFSELLKNGRKDEAIIINLLNIAKKASKKALKVELKNNKIIQSL